MPNIYSDSRICFGANSVPGTLPIGHFIDQSVATFWTSEFNQDLDNGYPYRSMKEWEDAPDNAWPDWETWNDHSATLKNKFQRFEEDMDWENPKIGKSKI